MTMALCSFLMILVVCGLVMMMWRKTWRKPFIKRLPKLAIDLSLAGILIAILPIAVQAQQVIVNNPPATNSPSINPSTVSQNQPMPSASNVMSSITPQVATGSRPASQTAAAMVSSSAPIPSPTQDPSRPSLAQINKPNDSQLSQANVALLTKNAELQRQVDSLNTQVNVLTNEKSGQLFMYGGFTALSSMLVGMGLGWLIFGRRKNEW